MLEDLIENATDGVELDMSLVRKYNSKNKLNKKVKK